MCDYMHRTCGVETVVLRPPGVWAEDTYEQIKALRADRRSYEWSPFWEYGAFIDVRDLAVAVHQAILAEYPGPRPFGVASDDINSSGPSSTGWVKRLHPGVPWRGDGSFVSDRHRTLLDNCRAKTALHWSSSRSWRPLHA